MTVGYAVGWAGMLSPLSLLAVTWNHYLECISSALQEQTSRMLVVHFTTDDSGSYGNAVAGIVVLSQMPLLAVTWKQVWGEFCGAYRPRSGGAVTLMTLGFGNAMPVTPGWQQWWDVWVL